VRTPLEKAKAQKVPAKKSNMRLLQKTEGEPGERGIADDEAVQVCSKWRGGKSTEQN